MSMSFDDVRIEIQKRYGVDDIQAKNAIKGFQILPLRNEFKELYQLNGDFDVMYFCDKVFSNKKCDSLFKKRYKHWTGLVEGAHGLHD